MSTGSNSISSNSLNANSTKDGEATVKSSIKSSKLNNSSTTTTAATTTGTGSGGGDGSGTTTNNALTTNQNNNSNDKNFNNNGASNGSAKGRGRPSKKSISTICAWCTENKPSLKYVLPTQSGKKEFCSQSCIAEFRKAYSKGACQQCDNAIRTNAPNREFCSTFCMNKFQRRNGSNAPVSATNNTNGIQTSSGRLSTSSSAAASAGGPTTQHNNNNVMHFDSKHNIYAPSLLNHHAHAGRDSTVMCYQHYGDVDDAGHGKDNTEQSMANTNALHSSANYRPPDRSPHYEPCRAFNWAVYLNVDHLCHFNSYD